MRVLLISHTCQSRTEGQPKAALLSRIPGVELKVLIPDRWKHYGKWRPTDVPSPDQFECKVGRVAWSWAGPAQFYLHWYPELPRIVKEFKPDVIDLWEEPWGLVSVLTCRVRNRYAPEAKIVTETEQNINKQLPFPFEKFRSYTLSQADYAVGRNSEAVAILKSKGYAGPAEVVPNAVDADLFHPLNRQECRDKLGFTGFVAGYVGRLVEEKGLGDMVDALKNCPKNVKLVFVGAGAFAESLQTQAKTLGVADRITFLPSRPLDQLPEVMNAMDVLVLPSRTTPSWKEQFGRVIIEAQACATPVIGSSSGAIPDVVGDGGLIFEERNSIALAQSLTDLASDSDRCRTMGLLGRKAVEQHYTWQRVAEQMYSIYEAVCAR